MNFLVTGIGLLHLQTGTMKTETFKNNTQVYEEQVQYHQILSSSRGLTLKETNINTNYLPTKLIANFD